MIVELVLAILFLLAVLNLWVTWRVMKDGLVTPSQRAAQTALIWLLPVLGALIILRLQRPHPEPHSGTYPVNADVNDGMQQGGPTHPPAHD